MDAALRLVPHVSRTGSSTRRGGSLANTTVASGPDRVSGSHAAAICFLSPRASRVWPVLIGPFSIRVMPRPQRTFDDDEAIPSNGHFPSVLPHLYDQEGEDEAVGAIGREGCLHTEGTGIQE